MDKDVFGGKGELQIGICDGVDMIINETIYEENESGQVINSALEDYMQVEGIWALYGKSKKSLKDECLNVGKSMNVGNEILYDIACLNLLKIREDGTENYINQFNEPCDFLYKSRQTQEYLYPIISSRYSSFRFVYIHDKSNNDIEKSYANKHHAIFWRNGKPYGVKNKN